MRKFTATLNPIEHKEKNKFSVIAATTYYQVNTF
jgi:hypothetical protein